MVPAPPPLAVIKPVIPSMRLCGPAFTVHTPPIDNLWIHRAIYEAKPGDPRKAPKKKLPYVVDDGAIVEGSVLMPGVRVGRGAVVRHAILDKNVVVGPGEMVGVDLEKDRERFAISAGGVVAVGKGVWI